MDPALEGLFVLTCKALPVSPSGVVLVILAGDSEFASCFAVLANAWLVWWSIGFLGGFV